jgi:4-amino-4-deoxy-L-arabinose transferase-like glycosyltransferase
VGFLLVSLGQKLSKGKKSFGPTVGTEAAVLASLYGTFIYFEGELLIPVLILFLDLGLILALLSAEQKSSWWRWLGCGTILGLSANVQWEEAVRLQPGEALRKDGQDR